MDDVTARDAYTAEQRETLESGLRILARMIARAQLRRDVRAGKDGSRPTAPAQGDKLGLERVRPSASCPTSLAPLTTGKGRRRVG